VDDATYGRSVLGSPFKAYDLRGRIPGEIDVAFMHRFGKAVAHELRPEKVVVGHDMRQESQPFALALAQGLLDCGVDVLPVGRCGTEEVYFHTAATGADVGLMVTASHNPADYNGLKMVLSGSRAATRQNAFDALERLVLSNTALASVAAYDERGQLADTLPRADYIDRLLQSVAGKPLKPMKIVVHAGNGCAGPIIDLLEPHLPFEFVRVDHEPDARLPNGIPNPLLPEKRERASRAVRETGADIGIAWDGDFDRCFLYDHRGEFVEGYYLVGMIAATMLRDHPGSAILYDPRACWNTLDIVQGMGGRAIACPTGHAFFKQKMREEDAVYGGEMSAHHYFRDFAYCDSGMLAWLAVVAELSERDVPLADLLAGRIAAFPCSGEINFKVADAATAQARIADLYAAKAVKIDWLDGLSMEFDDWRFNLRVSNTEPLLRLNLETRGDGKLLAHKTADLQSLITQ
jgi:phosphomannomutase / phosphoglucomutase